MAHAERERRQFGSLRKLPSKRWQATYTGPDTLRYRAPVTYSNKLAAEKWLISVRDAIENGTWIPNWGHYETEDTTVVTFEPYAAEWIKNRLIRERTRAEYESLLRRLINPTFGAMPIIDISPERVRSWHTELGADKPTQRARAYSLLRTILGDAARDKLIASNPCHIRGAGNTKRKTKIKIATLDELHTIVEAMPDRFKAMVLLAAWGSFRWGELTELRRKDVVLDTGLGFGVVQVRRGVVRLRGGFLVGETKSEAGIRDVEIPPHVLPAIAEHLAQHVRPHADDLLFPSATDPNRHLSPSTFTNAYYAAREVAGRPDLAFHHLRHTGATLAATSGATLAELKSRLGHSTAGAAMLYQHAAQDRDRLVAGRLSDIAAAARPPADHD